MALSIASSSSFTYKMAVETDLEADAKVNIFGTGVTLYSIDINNAANACLFEALRLVSESNGWNNTARPSVEGCGRRSGHRVLPRRCVVYQRPIDELFDDCGDGW